MSEGGSALAHASGSASSPRYANLKSALGCGFGARNETFVQAERVGGQRIVWDCLICFKEARASYLLYVVETEVRLVTECSAFVGGFLADRVAEF